MRQIVIDTETSGLNPEQGDRIVEIGALEIINRKASNNRYHQYINPEMLLSQKATSIHGLDNEFLADKPVFTDIADAFMEFIIGAELIIHNASFDVKFINHELKLLSNSKWKPLEEYCTITDTLRLSRETLIGQRSHSLDALCEFYNIDKSKRTLHGAMLDSELLCEVYLELTGGQTDIAFTTNTNVKHINTDKLGNLQLSEYIVSPADKIAHQDMLQSMRTDDKKVVWDDIHK